MSDPYAAGLAEADRRARPRGQPKSSRPGWDHAALARMPRQPERNRQIEALWMTTDLSFAQIGARVGCTRNTVAGVVDRMRARTLVAPKGVRW